MASPSSQASVIIPHVITSLKNQFPRTNFRVRPFQGGGREKRAIFQSVHSAGTGTRLLLELNCLHPKLELSLALNTPKTRPCRI